MITSFPRSLFASAESIALAIAPETASALLTVSRSGSATFVNANGLVETAGPDTLRSAHHINGVRTFLCEAARSNIVLHNRDLTNVAWVKTNATVARDQVGADGASNSASSITATAPNATVLQTMVAGVATRITSARVRRISGSGTIEMTQDNGATWTAITVTGSYTRQSIPSASVTNPVVGFRIVTSGDSIAVDYVQNEIGITPSSDIATTTGSVVRNADAVSVAIPKMAPPRALTMYVRGVELENPSATVSGQRGVLQISNAATADAYCALIKATAATGYRALHDPASLSISGAFGTTVATGNAVELTASIRSSGAAFGSVSVNRGATSSSTDGSAQAFAGAWSANTLYINSQGTTNYGLFAFERVLVVEGVRTLADMRLMAGG